MSLSWAIRAWTLVLPSRPVMSIFSIICCCLSIQYSQFSNTVSPTGCKMLESSNTIRLAPWKGEHSTEIIHVGQVIPWPTTEYQSKSKSTEKENISSLSQNFKIILRRKGTYQKIGNRPGIQVQSRASKCRYTVNILVHRNVEKNLEPFSNFFLKQSPFFKLNFMKSSNI